MYIKLSGCPDFCVKYPCIYSSATINNSMDTMTKKQRSYTMSRIRSKWTKPERTIHNYLKGMKIRHKMYPKICGNPDIILSDSKTAVFIHGCFWHGCPRHFRMPKSNKEYWSQKIKSNIRRDKKAEKLLKVQGYRIVKIWEHDLKRINKLLPFSLSKS